MPDPVKIPEIIAELRELAAEHQLPRLEILADELRRRPPVQRAPNTSEPMTPSLRTKIRLYAADHPAETFAAIGRHFNVNPGRVSETLAGYRD